MITFLGSATNIYWGKCVCVCVCARARADSLTYMGMVEISCLAHFSMHLGMDAVPVTEVYCS